MRRRGKCQQSRRRAEANKLFCKIDRVHGHKLVLTKTVLSFVSPFVSPGMAKMGKLLITRDDGNNYSRYSDTAVCALLTTSANSCKNAVFALGNLRSIR